MSRKSLRLVIGFSLAMALSAGSLAGPYKVVGEKGDFYFGHISYVDDGGEGKASVVFRLGARAPEIGVLNTPLGPGDMIQTSDRGRCELQFDNGTIVRLDVSTKLKIETILAQTLSTAQKVSNLLLAQGQVYVMYRKHNSLELFQVILPRASVKLSDNAVALIETSDGPAAVQVERGRVELLYGRDDRDLDRKKVNAGERVVIGADDLAQPGEYAGVSEFKSWNEKVNANFPALHEGNALPKPLQKLPPAVFEFAQKFGNLNGEWIWHDLYGYVWRPYLNDLRYPWGTWQPYFYGNWTDYNGQLYWVPAEPWGWVPYHLGLWMWDEKSGWVWMPGSLFAPAWVDWEFFYGHYFWRPFSLFDYYEGWESDPYYWGTVSWAPGFGVVDGTRPGYPSHTTPVRSVVTKDSLKQKPQPSLPVPKEMKSALRAAADALKRGDAGAEASLREMLRRSIIVSKTEFGRPGWQQKTVSLDRFLERPELKERGPRSFERVPSDVVAGAAQRSLEAARTMREVKAGMDPALQNPNRAPAPGDFRFSQERQGSRPDAAIRSRGEGGGRPASAVAGPGPTPGGENPGNRGPSRPGMRFRDWNPDVKAAVGLGVDIAYSSRTNEVYSSQLGLRSRDIISRGRSSAGIQGFSPGSGLGSSSGMSSGGAASSGAVPGSSSSPAASSGPRGSSKESGGGKQK